MNARGLRRPSRRTAPAVAGAPPYVPGTIAGLVLALEADVGVSGTSWTDQSAQGNNATLVGSPSAGTPINGHATLTLNGSAYVTIPSAASLNVGSNEPWDVLIVANTPTPSSTYSIFWSKTSVTATNFQGWVYNGAGGTPLIFYNDASSHYAMAGDGSGPPTMSFGTAQLLEWGANGGGAGGTIRYGIGSSTAELSQDCTLGAGSNTDPLTLSVGDFAPDNGIFDLAAIYVYKGNYLSSEDRATLVSYINSKYGSVG